LEDKVVWVFCGDGDWPKSSFPSGVFSDFQLAREWIEQHRLSGCLTKYPLDTGVYDWCIHHSFFKPKNDLQRSSEFIGRFSSAALTHHHFELGVMVA
jgi:hypothetical protein